MVLRRTLVRARALMASRAAHSVAWSTPTTAEPYGTLLSATAISDTARRNCPSVIVDGATTLAVTK